MGNNFVARTEYNLSSENLHVGSSPSLSSPRGGCGDHQGNFNRRGGGRNNHNHWQQQTPIATDHQHHNT